MTEKERFPILHKVQKTLALTGLSCFLLIGCIAYGLGSYTQSADFPEVIKIAGSEIYLTSTQSTIVNSATILAILCILIALPIGFYMKDVLDE